MPISGPVAKLRRNSASRQAFSDEATKISTRCAYNLPGLSIQFNNHVCRGWRREFFDRNVYVTCTRCGRHWRREGLYRNVYATCTRCGRHVRKKTLARHRRSAKCRLAPLLPTGATENRFDPQDLRNRGRPDLHGNVLFCGCGANSCSTMTTLKLVTLFFSSDTGGGMI